MAKRYLSTDVFHEDWFVELEPEHKLFWFYALMSCDHAGFLRVNLRVFNALNNTSVDADDVFKKINAEKARLREITPRLWFVEDFICFQYGQTLNPTNRVHKSVQELLEKNGVSLTSIKGLVNPLQGVKDKEKEKDKDNRGESGREGRPIDFDECIELFKSVLTQQGLPLDAFGDVKDLATSYVSHYGSQGWRKNNGMSVTDHRLNIVTWVMREKRKNSSSKTETIKRPWD